MIEVRQLLEEDILEIWIIQKKSFQEDFKLNRDFSPAIETLESFTERTKKYDVFTILYNKHIVGGMFVKEYNTSRIWKLSRIFIEPEFQSKGIGSFVINYIQEKYKDVDTWILETPEKNKKGQIFYENNGFKNIGITKITENLNTINYIKENI
ncbi:MAG: GNAT family N-acetyltransferase [Bacilli bacterium]